MTIACISNNLSRRIAFRVYVKRTWERLKNDLRYFIVHTSNTEGDRSDVILDLDSFKRLVLVLARQQQRFCLMPTTILLVYNNIIAIAGTFIKFSESPSRNNVHFQRVCMCVCVCFSLLLQQLVIKQRDLARKPTITWTVAKEINGTGWWNEDLSFPVIEYNRAKPFVGRISNHAWIRKQTNILHILIFLTTCILTRTHASSIEKYSSTTLHFARLISKLLSYI